MRKTVTPPGERGRDGLRRDDTTPQSIVTIVTPVTANAPESSFGANRCQVKAQKPKVKAALRAKRRGEKPDSSLRRFRFQVTAKTAKSDSGGKSVRKGG